MRRHWRVVSALVLAWATVAGAQPKAPRANWDFRFKDFVIGAWWGPDCNDVELAMYRECGFNTVMTGRYMNLYGTGDDGEIRRQLDLCGKHGLKVFMDTYAKNEKPWGGQKLPPSEHPTHHPASVEELAWLIDKVGNHPALIGFMIGDDQGAVSPRSKGCTDLLYAKKPHLMPWLCGWISPANLAANNNPIGDPQIYPTLYSPGQSAEAHARSYAQTYWDYSRACQANGVLFWPMFNAAPPNPATPVSDSLLRYPAYLALAYGAEGYWYFCYNSDSLQKLGPHKTPEEAVAARTANWPVAREVNQRALPWGRRVLGRTSSGLFGTAFTGGNASWPFPEPAAKLPAGLNPPAAGKLITGMSSDLIVGILTSDDARPLAMVVNARVSKVAGELPDRPVTVTFAPAVRGIRVLGAGDWTQPGSTVKLMLQPGGGQMLELDGDPAKLAALCSSEAITAPVPAIAAQPVTRAVTQADLVGLREARLKLDIFGS
ncbi:MAG: hypothetical protein HZB16_16075, partial [Armatimonadetes bacterium]|nr:hypothetical protein [Armatimonadota bacterium]